MKRSSFIFRRAATAWRLWCVGFVVVLAGCSASLSARTEPADAKPADDGAKAPSTVVAVKEVANAAAEATTPAGDPMDWTNWRGPDQNGASREVGLVDSWDPDTGKNVLWKRAEMGTRSTPIVMNGKLYA